MCSHDVKQYFTDIDVYILNMKKIVFILLIATCTTAMAQEVSLPWIPGRDTNHIRTIRYFSYDTTTMERKLIYTENYDRHGYLTHPLTRLTYNEQGLLTQNAVLREVLSSNGTVERLDTSSVFDISYSSDGVIQRIKEVRYGYYHSPKDDTVIVIYELLTHKSHPDFGLLDYTFNCCWTSNGEPVYCDTIYLRREYDDQGRLLKHYTNYEDDRKNYTYHYHTDGRIDYRIGFYYEWWDSLSYHYNEKGVLTHMTGRLYDLEAEADVFIRCQPDGRRIEERQTWYTYEEDGLSTTGTLDILEYDSHGLLIRSRTEGRKTPYFECEIDYWE